MSIQMRGYSIKCRFFPTGTLIQGGTLISAVRFFPIGTLIQGGILIRVLRVYEFPVRRFF